MIDQMPDMATGAKSSYFHPMNEINLPHEIDWKLPE
jgi:hypothetical protein